MGGQTPMNNGQGHRKGWFQRSLEFWSPFWIMVAGLCAVASVVLTLALVGLTTPTKVIQSSSDHNVSPRPSPPPSSPSSPSNTPSSPPSASQIANDVTDETVNDTRHSGATVSSATCYPASVSQSAAGTAYAECDVAYSDGADFRVYVTDNDGNASFQEQYQENLSPDDIADYAVGDVVTSGSDTGATVSSATCYTAQLSSNGWTYADCDLDLSNDAEISATVEDNGIRSGFQS
jgi:hypothetical protein